MVGKKWIFGSLLAAITLITTAASPARAEDQRWNLGRPQWQPPAHAGWANNERERDWRGNSDWGHQRDAWWQRDHDNRRWERERWERERRERERRHEWWQRHHDRRWD